MTKSNKSLRGEADVKDVGNTSNPGGHLAHQEENNAFMLNVPPTHAASEIKHITQVRLFF